MTQTSLPPVGDNRRIEERTNDRSLAYAIERLLTAGIGITARAIGDSPAASTLTLAQWRVLVIASRTEGLRVGELAARLGISVPSASRLVRRIEARNLLTAARAEDDRRATIVGPTDAGRKLVGDVVTRRRDLIGEALRDRPRREDTDAIAQVEDIAARLAEFT